MPNINIKESTRPQCRVFPLAHLLSLMEEFQIVVSENNLIEFGIFQAPAAGQEHRMVKMEVFVVKSWEGVPTPDNEVEEIRWITSAPEQGIKIGSIFEHEVIPRLKTAHLID